MNEPSALKARSRSALFVTDYVPQLGFDSCSRRCFHLIELLSEEGWRVSVIARHGPDGESRVRLESMGVGVHTSGEPEAETLLDERSVDLAILCRWQVAEPYLPRLRAGSSKTRIVVDIGGLQFVGEARRRFASGAADPAGPLDGAYADETIRELNVYAQADCVTTATARAVDLLVDLSGNDQSARLVPDCEDLPTSTVPFEERRGVLFVGDFGQAPDVEAVRYLINDIVPLLDAEVLERHPITVIGSELHRLPGDLKTERPGLVMLGWVPAVERHLENARVSIAPFPQRAETQRRIIQALTSGTPAVATTLAIEGLALAAGVHVLIGDTPVDFVRQLTTLLTDAETWRSLARLGRERILAGHSREAGRAGLLEMVDRVMARAPARGRTADELELARDAIEARAYRRMVSRLLALVSSHLAATASIAVVSRGDDDMLSQTVRRAWHFPRTSTGLYSGHHPTDSAAAIASLENARAQGVEFLVLPATSYWWLGYYDGWRRHLESNYPLVALDPDCGAIFDLRPEAQARGCELDPKIYDALTTTTLAWSSDLDRISFADAELPESLHGEPLISVVIPTRNRAPYLRLCLEGLAHQSLPRERYEVVVVSDGSTDATADVCASFASRFPLRYLPIEHGGIAMAKNHGTAAAAGWIVLHFDDDDVAHPDLLLEHLRAHSAYQQNEVAVLGLTEWDRSLQVNEVMRFVTDVGHHLFSYHGIKTGDVLDFTYFWGGRTSCKRQLLLRHGTFDPSFRFGSEDIELAYRLSKRGLRVLFNRGARQRMIRDLTFQQFCDRCERQGASLKTFSRLHPDPVVERYCGAGDAERRWAGVEPLLPLKVELTRRVEALHAASLPGPGQGAIRGQLWELYGWCFDAYRLKGFVESSPDRVEPVNARLSVGDGGP